MIGYPLTRVNLALLGYESIRGAGSDTIGKPIGP